MGKWVFCIGQESLLHGQVSLLHRARESAAWASESAGDMLSCMRRAATSQTVSVLHVRRDMITSGSPIWNTVPHRSSMLSECHRGFTLTSGHAEYSVLCQCSIHYTVIRFVSVSAQFGIVLSEKGTLLKLKCAHSPLSVRIISSTSVPFTLMNVQVPNLALVETKLQYSVCSSFGVPNLARCCSIQQMGMFNFWRNVRLVKLVNVLYNFGWAAHLRGERFPPYL